MKYNINKGIFVITVVTALNIIFPQLKEIESVFSSLVFGGLVLIFFPLYFILSGKVKPEDERTSQIDDKGFRASWNLTLLVLSVYIFIGQFRTFTFSPKLVVSAVFFFMVFSYWVMKLFSFFASRRRSGSL